MAKKGGFQELLYSTIMPKVYGIGASIVITGAMFKLLHLTGAGAMLGVGLTTEAIIFFLSAFEPKKQEPDWTKVYPELAEDYDGPVGARAGGRVKSGDSVSKKLDALMESNKIGPELVESLGRGMNRLAETSHKLGRLGEAATATTQYADSMKAAASTVERVNKSYGESVNNMVAMANVSREAAEQMGNVSKDSKEYHMQVQSVTKNLGALNAVYEMELQDANSHIKAMNKFYSNLTGSMESMAQATQDAEQFKVEINKLTSNLTKLNNIYGGMINAMKS
jgi:gliding motility-associated protein GldL